MATGLSQAGGEMSPADLAGAGDLEWAATAGISPAHPLVGGPDVIGLGSFDVDRGRSRVVTQYADPVGDRPLAHANLFDNWRDTFDFRNSPVPWLLLFAFAAIGFMQLRIEARGGPASVRAALG